MMMNDENAHEVRAATKERKMTADDLYESCKAQLKILGFTLQGRHTYGFDGRYKGKHILRVEKKEHQGLNIDVKKADDKWRGWEPANDKQALDKVFDDYIKPQMESDKAQNSVSEIVTIARDIGNILKVDYTSETFKENLNVRLKQLEDKLHTLKAYMNALK
ncbi:MAG: hypothetical protein ABSA18_01420 [Dehalococcoidia bacterium]